MSRSGYYKWQNRGQSSRQKERERLIPVVKEIDRQSKGSYGTRRISEKLKSNGERCGRYKARTLMKLAGVTARQAKKFKVTTDSKHNFPVAPNLLDRQFEVEEPNRVWVSDITYLWTTEGWLYLAVIIDLFSRKVIGWSLNKRITKYLVMNALQCKEYCKQYSSVMAIWRRGPGSNLIFHSDRGSQYCSNEFQDMLA